MRSAPALAVAQVLVLVVVTVLIGVAAAAPPPPCDGTTGPGCSCPRAGTTVGSSIAVDFRTGEVTVSLVGVTHEGTVVTGIAYGDNECRTFNQDDLVCEGPEFNCECSLKDSFTAFLNRCNQSVVAFSPTSRGFVIPVHANFSRTTYNLLGDPVVSHSSTSNVVHVNTVSVAAGAGSVQFGLLDVQVLAGRLLAAVPGTNTTTLIVPVRVTSKPVTLVPASVTFEDPAVSSSVTLTHTTCHSGAPACDINFDVALRTSADLGSFVGTLAFTVQPVCDDGCPPIGIDITFSDYFPTPYTRVAVADVEASVDVTTQVLQPVGTSTAPARSVITSRALSPAGAVVPSKIQGVFMFHKQDDVPCDDTTPSTPVVNALLEPLVPWLSVNAVGLDDGTLTLSALQLTLSVLATPEYVAPILNELQGSAAGRARMQKSRTLDICVVAVHEINPFGSVARRVSTLSSLTVDAGTLAVDAGRSLAEAEARGQSSAYSAEAKFTLDMPPLQPPDTPPCEGFGCWDLWAILAGAAAGVGFVVAGTVAIVKLRQRGGASSTTSLPNVV